MREDDAVDSWVPFRRSDTAKVVDLVRAVADARDPGEHGQGVEVVVEAPRERLWRGRWWQALFNRDDALAQARIVVTRDGGEVRYPFDIQLVTAHGADAAHRLGTAHGMGRQQLQRPGLPHPEGHGPAEHRPAGHGQQRTAPTSASW